MGTTRKQNRRYSNKNLQVPQWHLEACCYSTNSAVGISLVRDNLDVVFLEDVPLLLFRVELGVDEAEPVLVVLSRIVRLIVEARVTGLFAELDVT